MSVSRTKNECIDSADKLFFDTKDFHMFAVNQSDKIIYKFYPVQLNGYTVTYTKKIDKSFEKINTEIMSDI